MTMMVKQDRFLSLYVLKLLQEEEGFNSKELEKPESLEKQ